MSLENKTALSNHRLKKAEEALSDAKMLVDAERYSAAANRSYYAIFYAIRAVLALDGIDRKHHSAVIAEFRKLYIKTGVFDSSLSDIIGESFDLRSDSDYDDFFVVSREEITEQVQNAEVFIQTIKSYRERQ